MLYGAFALIVGIIQFNQIRFCTLNGFLIDLHVQYSYTSFILLCLPYASYCTTE